MARLVVPFLLLLAAAAPAQGFTLEHYHPDQDMFLVEGHNVTVLFEGAEGAHLRAIYRPGSEVHHTEEIGAVTGDKLEWAPTDPGLVQLDLYRPAAGEAAEAVLASKVVSVRFDTSLPSGLFVMILAGLFLFGGAFKSIRALLRG